MVRWEGGCRFAWTGGDAQSQKFRRSCISGHIAGNGGSRGPSSVAPRCATAADRPSSLVAPRLACLRPPACPRQLIAFTLRHPHHIYTEYHSRSDLGPPATPPISSRRSKARSDAFKGQGCQPYLKSLASCSSWLSLIPRSAEHCTVFFLSGGYCTTQARTAQPVLRTVKQGPASAAVRAQALHHSHTHTVPLHTRICQRRSVYLYLALS
jgi:hypothetical protein